MTPASPGPRWYRGLLTDSSAVAIGTLVASILGYGFAIILSRSLGPASYGALGALLAIAIISTIPATALQLVIARRVARHGAHVRPQLNFSLGLSLVLSGIFLLLAPLVSVVLHIDSVYPALWLALLLAPQTMVGAFNGVLLGSGHMVRFSVGLVVVAGGRLVAGAVAAASGWSLTGALGAAAVAALVTMALVAALTLQKAPEAWRAGHEGQRSFAHEVWVTAIGMTSLLVLVNIDVLAARVALPSVESGIYAFATLFGRASLWGTQFLGFAIFPRVARGEDRRRLLVLAAGTTAAIGAVITIAAGVIGDVVVHVLAGEAFASAAHYAIGFGAAGVLLALTQVALFTDIARHGTWVTKVIWATSVAFAVLVVLVAHDSVKAVLLADLACLALGTTASLIHLLRSRP